MRIPRFVLILVLTVGGLLLSVSRSSTNPIGSIQTQSAELSARENAYRSNNIGVALLEQFKPKEGAEAFKRALQIDQKLNLARVNLAIALFNEPDLPGAQREAQAAISADPNLPHPQYILGLIAKSQGRAEDALASFQRVLKIDPNDTGANINLGQVYALQRKYPEAIAAFRIALAAEPYNSTALYNLGQVLIRSGQREEGQKVIQRFQELRERGSGTSLGQSYLEQGRYAEAIVSTGIEPNLVDRSTPRASFTDATATVLPGQSSSADAKLPPPSPFGRSYKNFAGDMRSAISSGLGGGMVLLDYDEDGKMDLFSVSQSEQRLYHNEGGKFIEVTAKAGGLNTKQGGTAAVAGDYDNDGSPDLVVIRDGSLSLFHNDGNGTFSDATSKAGIPGYPYLSATVSLVDVDHDGDLDIFVGGLADLSKPPASTSPAIFPNDFAPAPNLLLRNDGTGKFTDTTAAAKVNGGGHAIAIVPTDFNNRRDVDLLIVNYGVGPNLFSNQRDGTFRDVAGEVGLDGAGGSTCAAAGDVNKDGFTDFFFGRANGPAQFAISDGKEKFKAVTAPSGTEGASAAQFLDYDNDGLLDCVLITSKGLRIWRNAGNSWIDVTEQAVTRVAGSESALASIDRLLVSGDLDGDGDTDVLSGGAGGLRVGRNDGGNNNYSLRVSLTGKISNRSGAGAKIDVRAGSLAQKLEAISASPAPAPSDVIFGLGKRPTADAVRVIWPAGIVQSETEIPRSPDATKVAMLTLSVIELDRKPSSCPFLYAWNGERFEFVTDFMGGGEMGYLEEPGRYNKPDPDEYVRLRDDQLREKNGKFEIRVTNELEEALFVDRLQLLAVTHRNNVEVYPNEGMTDPPKPAKLYFTLDARPPLSAVDDHGHNVLELITALDRRYPDDFRLERIRGYAQEHSLTMDLGKATSRVQRPKPNTGRTVLLMTGWTDYAWSSDNVAASQAGHAMKLPALQVRDSKGNWQTVIDDIGIPVGRPQTVVVDLTGKFLSASREVRVVTSMRIYWDQILVDTSDGRPEQVITRLEPTRSSLSWRGFSWEASPDGREPLGYNYEKVSYVSPWKVMSGRYTREGDVLELLSKTDDMFVISLPGDEIAVSFAATALPPLAAGWKRTFLLYADGFSKEMDINSASPYHVGPLPFHGMTKYPYSWPEKYPLTAERSAYLENYNTRVVKSHIPSIETALVGR